MSRVSALLLVLLLVPTRRADAQSARQNVPLSARQSTCAVILAADAPTSGRPQRAIARETATAAPTALARARTRQLAPRIVNGNFASLNLQAAVAVLFVSRSFCTAIILSAKWLLTAAHCEATVDSIVYIGASQVERRGLSLFGRHGFRRRLRQAITHPDYDDDRVGSEFDIALLQLRRGAPRGARFMHVNADNSLPIAGSITRIVGYGLTMSDGSMEPVDDAFRLRQVDIPAVDDATCESVFRFIVEREFHLCTGYMDGGCGACQGDSGGPVLQYNDNDTAVVVGITSFGRDCDLTFIPGVAVRVATHVEWMKETGAVFTVSVPRAVDMDGNQVNDSRTPMPIPGVAGASATPTATIPGTDSVDIGGAPSSLGLVLILTGALLALGAVLLLSRVLVVYKQRRDQRAAVLEEIPMM